ncbi:MAG: imidazole glycerol phosphate synthase subunit HisH [Bryobacteraceae bacterium]|nr:imidazole glycerol phosphate synthase subunit HisH [Bryobacteraceae bacterium]
MITILDYGAGNLQSVRNTLEKAGAAHRVVRDPQSVAGAGKLILPGVGHFGQMMRALDALQLREPLLERMRAGAPFLGICLGLQALFPSSEEAPDQPGLGVLEGRIRRFPSHLRVPHMGWNELIRRKPSKLLHGLGDRPYVYFANSYCAPVVDSASATCTYQDPFTAVIEQDNVYAVQFHPEKSGPAGLAIIRNFAELC